MGIEIGKTQKLSVLRQAEHGIYLGTASEAEGLSQKKDLEERSGERPGERPGVTVSADSVLLPRKEVPERVKEGDVLEVFVYRDSEDRPIATRQHPAAEVGEFAYLTVRTAAKMGAFLDWGLPKDLFLPFAEQERPLKAGEKVLVRIYLDKSGRIAASMKVYEFLSADTFGKFKKDDAFSGYVYRVVREIGAFIAVKEEEEKKSGKEIGKEIGKETGKESGKEIKKESGKEQKLETLYYGLIPAPQLFTPLKAGDEVSGRILRVRKDGKLDLEIRQRAYKQIEEDSRKLLDKIREYDGVLPFSESVSPETVKRELEMSKAAFKRALGHLLKEGKVEIRNTEIQLLP